MKLIITILLLAIGTFAEEYWVFIQRDNQPIPEPVFKTDTYSLALIKMCNFKGHSTSTTIVSLHKGECKFSEKSNHWICKEFITSVSDWNGGNCLY